MAETRIIVWEGVDGSGKTTLKESVAKILEQQGLRIGNYKTPSDTLTGQLAKSYGNSGRVDGLTRMLLFLSNTTDDSSIMRNEISKNKYDFYFIVRYYLCSLVYGLALLKKSHPNSVEYEDLPNLIEAVERVGREVVVKPDAYVIVDVDEETRRRRLAEKFGKKRPLDVLYESDPKLQAEIRKFYRFFAKTYTNDVVWINNAEGMLSEASKQVADKLLDLRSRGNP